MSLMNLQKLRQICHWDGDRLKMEIILPPNDPANRVEFEDLVGVDHIVQVDSITCKEINNKYKIQVAYSTEEDPSSFSDINVRQVNRALAQVFLPRLREILVEHGFHSRYLPKRDIGPLDSKPFNLFYIPTQGFLEQIGHACYEDGGAMRRALNFQMHLNKTGTWKMW